MMEEIHSKINSSLHAKYELVWNFNQKKSPIRFKTNSTKKFVAAANEAWLLALIDLTDSEYKRLDKYIRICVPFQEDIVAISIFPTGTILFQGSTSVTWAGKFMPQICKLVSKEIDVLLADDSLNGSLITDKSVEVLGLCAECDSPDDDYMIACDKCNNWLHHKCVGLTEEKARGIYRYYCNNCYLKYDLQTQYDKLPATTDKTSTPLPDSKVKPLVYGSTEDSTLSDIRSEDLSTSSDDKNTDSSSEIDVSKKVGGVINKFKKLTTSLFSTTGATPSEKKSLKKYTKKPPPNIPKMHRGKETQDDTASNHYTSVHSRDNSVGLTTDTSSTPRLSLDNARNVDASIQCDLNVEPSKSNISVQCAIPPTDNAETQITTKSSSSQYDIKKCNVRTQTIDISTKDPKAVTTPKKDIGTQCTKQLKSHSFTQTPEDDRTIVIHNLQTEIQTLKSQNDDTTMQLQTIAEKLAIAESLLQCTGDKKQRKHRLEYRSYNELIKECLKQEEIKDKLNSKIDDLLHVKFSLNTNISQLKEEIKSLEGTLSAKDALHQHSTPRFDLEVHIKSLRSQLNDEYQERNNYLLQLQGANDQINSQSRTEKTLLD